MKTRRRQLSWEGVKGSFREAGELGGEEGRKSSTNRYWPCSGAGLEGVFPLSIGESGRMEQVQGNDLGNNFA